MPDLQAVLQDGTPQDIAALFADEHPADIAAALEKMPSRDAWRALQQTSVRQRADVFGYFPHAYQSLLATVIPRAALTAVVMEMKADERADLYQELSGDQRETLMPALAQAEREDIRQLASYGEGTAGAIMTSEYAAIPRVQRHGGTYIVAAGSTRRGNDQSRLCDRRKSQISGRRAAAGHHNRPAARANHRHHGNEHPCDPRERRQGGRRAPDRPL